MLADEVASGKSRPSWPLIWAAQVPAIGASIALMAVWAANSAQGRLFTLFDDAMISMSYARTLARTGTFVWYPGAPRVQGFSNPLWSMWMALVHFIGFEGSNAALAVALSGLALIVLTGIAATLLVSDLTSCLRSSAAFALAAGAVTSLCFPLLFWTLRGMEVGLVTCLLAWTVLAVRRAFVADGGQHNRSWVLFAMGLVALGVLTRIDFAVLAVGVAAALIINHPRIPVARRMGLLLLGAALATAALVLATQYWYYGDPLPVTYYLKMDGVTLVERVLRGVASTAKSLPVLIAAAASYSSLRQRLSRSPLDLIHLDVIAAAALAAIAYQAWVGGDAWEWSMVLNRFISTAIPMIVVLIFAALALWGAHSRNDRQLRPHWPLMLLIAGSALAAGIQTNPYRFDVIRAATYVAIITLACALVLVALGVARVAHRSPVRFLAASTAAGFWLAVSAMPLIYSFVLFGTVGPLTNFDAITVNRAQALARQLDAPTSIATVRAGADSYYLGQRMFDILGKNDPVVAKSKPHREADAKEFSTFYPGHDKWDYAWTIGDLHPDIIMDMWVTTEADIDWLENLGYARVCLNDGSQVWASESSLLRNRHLIRCASG